MMPFRTASLLQTIDRENLDEAACWVGTLTVQAATLGLLAQTPVQTLLQFQDGFGWVPLGSVPGFSLGWLGLAALCAAAAWQQGRRLRG